MPIRIAINGFGRIGKQAFKIAFEKKGMDVVAINDLGENASLAHGLTYDSVYGKYEKEVLFDEGNIIVAGKKIPVSKEPDPTKLPWKQHAVDVVLECTGRFTDKGAARAHLQAGAKHVIISAPTKGSEVKTFVLGVNDTESKGEDIISNASCTTNCIAPVMEIMTREFGVVKAAMTTVHAYTADQRLVDGDHKDLRRARAASVNIIPTTTGAASALGEVIPETAGIFDGLALRVPVPVGSLSDFTILVKRKTTKEEVNEVLTRESKTDRYKKILAVTADPIVSSDIVGSSFSSIVDLSLTNVIAGDLVKILSWYDNEWGYSTRLVEMAEVVMKD